MNAIIAQRAHSLLPFKEAIVRANLSEIGHGQVPLLDRKLIHQVMTTVPDLPDNEKVVYMTEDVDGRGDVARDRRRLVPSLFVPDGIMSGVANSAVNSDGSLPWHKQLLLRERLSGSLLKFAGSVPAEAISELGVHYPNRSFAAIATRLAGAEVQFLSQWTTGVVPEWHVISGITPSRELPVQQMLEYETAPLDHPALPSKFVDTVFASEEVFRNSSGVRYLGRAATSERGSQDIAAMFSILNKYDDAAEQNDRLLRSERDQPKLFLSYCSGLVNSFNASRAHMEGPAQSQHSVLDETQRLLRGSYPDKLDPSGSRKKEQVEKEQSRVHAVMVSDAFLIKCIGSVLFSAGKGPRKEAYSLVNDNQDVSSIMLRLGDHSLLTVVASEIQGMNWVHLSKFHPRLKKDDVDEILQGVLGIKP